MKQEKPKTYTIIVNGREKEVESEELSWRELALLAFPNGQFGEPIEYNITYSKGPKENREGTLVEGQTVTIKNRMNFHVKRTDRS